MTIVDAKDKRQRNQDRNDNAQHPPLQFPRSSSRSDTFDQLIVSLPSCLVDMISLFFDARDLRLLVDDLLVQVLEDQGQLAQCLLNALDIVVTSTNSAENARGLCAIVALDLQLVSIVTDSATVSAENTDSLRENAFIAPVGIGHFADFGFSSFGIDDLVLAANRIAASLGVV
jgi:hypothetical protein